MARILVIEDEASIRANLVRFIQLEGHEAIEAGDGQAGLAAARTQVPDFIFCDVMMPRMGGFEVLTALAQVAGSSMFFRLRSECPGLQRKCVAGRPDFMGR